MAQMNFATLRELHDSVNYLLHSPETMKSLSHHGQEKWVEEVAEASLRMLDVCSVSKDVILLVKQHLQDLQLTLRGNESDISQKIAAYNRYRSKLRKETLKCLNALKGMRGGENGGRAMPSTEQNLLFVVEVLKEVRKATVSMVESLFSLVCIPWLERKSSKGSLSSIFTMRSYCDRSGDGVWNETAVQSATTRLEAAEIAVEELEAELECIFRRLIQTRVSLLNILTS